MILLVRIVNFELDCGMSSHTCMCQFLSVIQVLLNCFGLFHDLEFSLSGQCGYDVDRVRLSLYFLYLSNNVHRYLCKVLDLCISGSS